MLRKNQREADFRRDATSGVSASACSTTLMHHGLGSGEERGFIQLLAELPARGCVERARAPLRCRAGPTRRSTRSRSCRLVFLPAATGNVAAGRDGSRVGSSRIENLSQRTDAVGTKSQCTVPSASTLTNVAPRGPVSRGCPPWTEPGSWAIPLRLANVRRARPAPNAR